MKEVKYFIPVWPKRAVRYDFAKSKLNRTLRRRKKKGWMLQFRRAALHLE